MLWSTEEVTCREMWTAGMCQLASVLIEEPYHGTVEYSYLHLTTQELAVP